MRTEIIERKLYKFEELSEEGKERAIEMHREFTANNTPWQGENKDTLEAFESIFPVKIKDWEYGNQNYINWKFVADYDEIENLTGWRLVSYLWNNYKSQIFKGKYYSTKGEMINGKYRYKHRHSRIFLDNCCVITGYCMDDDILKDVYEYMKKPDSRTFHDLMNDCLYNWVYACRDEYEYQLSDESIIENIEANEYEFTENGELA